jgi:hypothetical protein
MNRRAQILVGVAGIGAVAAALFGPMLVGVGQHVSMTWSFASGPFVLAVVTVAVGAVALGLRSSRVLAAIGTISALGAAYLLFLTIQRFGGSSYVTAGWGQYAFIAGAVAIAVAGWAGLGSSDKVRSSVNHRDASA